ncbi:lipase family protein [Candidatus Gracilibacteria bacterium]|nr:lipase family protein [Candidatus Gracilibacteria bacterium]MCF7819299.1 lipase family protein [Candidatus Gracilibacteria bacterium]
MNQQIIRRSMFLFCVGLVLAGCSSVDPEKNISQNTTENEEILSESSRQPAPEGVVTPPQDVTDVSLEESEIIHTAEAKEDPAEKQVIEKKAPEKVLTQYTFIHSFSRAQVEAATDRFHLNYAHKPAQYAVKKYQVRFLTRHEGEEKIKGYALAYIPTDAPQPIPLMVTAPGTTGIDDRCAPSKEDISVANWGDYEGFNLSYAGQGYGVIMPDYSGFNDEDGLHHYFIAHLEGKVILDSGRALREIMQEENISFEPGFFLNGYSQGAHATLAAADMNGEYAPDILLRGIIGYGAAANVFDLLKNNAHLAPYFIYAYSDFYGRDRFDPEEIMESEWVTTLEKDTTSKCVGEAGEYYGHKERPLYSQKFQEALFGNNLQQKFPQVYKLMVLNNTGLRDFDVPVFLLQGETDTITPLESQKIYAQELCRQGKRVTFHELPGIDHVYTRQSTHHETLRWIEALRNDEDIPDYCS